MTTDRAWYMRFMELCRKKEEGEEKCQDVKKQSIGFRVAKEGKPEYCKVRGQGQAQDRDGAAGDRWCGWYLTTSCNLQQQGGVCPGLDGCRYPMQVEYLVK